MPSRTFRFWTVVAGLHLAVVFVSGTGFWTGWDLGRVSPILRLYAGLTGADGYFGFFAPNVGSQLDVRFEAVERSGARIEGKLLTGNREADLRIGNLIAAFWSEPVDRKLKRALAASWAGKVFARYPDAHQVHFRVSALALPSRKEFRQGLRPEWREYYRSTFERPREGE